jgi:hypothetical protein
MAKDSFFIALRFYVLLHFLTTEVRRSTEGRRVLVLALSNSVTLCVSVV